MAKLPKLELHKFSGDVTQWQSFWNKSIAIVHGSVLSTVSKLTYLLLGAYRKNYFRSNPGSVEPEGQFTGLCYKSGVTVTQYGVILTALIFSRLPQDI